MLQFGYCPKKKHFAKRFKLLNVSKNGQLYFAKYFAKYNNRLIQTPLTEI